MRLRDCLKVLIASVALLPKAHGTAARMRRSACQVQFRRAAELRRRLIESIQAGEAFCSRDYRKVIARLKFHRPCQVR